MASFINPLLQGRKGRAWCIFTQSCTPIHTVVMWYKLETEADSSWSYQGWKRNKTSGGVSKRAGTQLKPFILRGCSCRDSLKISVVFSTDWLVTEWQTCWCDCPRFGWLPRPWHTASLGQQILRDKSHVKCISFGRGLGTSNTKKLPCEVCVWSYLL